MRHRLYMTALALACVWAVGLIVLALAGPSPNLLVPRPGYEFARQAGREIVQIADADVLTLLQQGQRSDASGGYWNEWTFLSPEEVEKHNADAMSGYLQERLAMLMAGLAPLVALIALAKWWKWVQRGRTYRFRPSSWRRVDAVPLDGPETRDDS